jgi:serine/threonine protein kinase
LFYLAPEALKIYLGEPHFNSFCHVNAKIDSFAFGLTILEILDNIPDKLFGLMNQTQIDHEIQQCAKRVRSSSSKTDAQIKLAMIEVASQLLKHNPSQRINCAQATTQLEKIAQSCIA